MNFTWHIVKKDIRRFRLPLALWAGLIIAQTILSFMLFRWTDEDVGLLRSGINGLDILHEILWGMQLVLGFVLVAGLVHEDSLVGHQTWWVTRPITGSQLLAAKVAAGILFFLVLPVLALLPWWLFCGYGVNEVMWASFQIMLGQAVVSLLAFGLAVLTANYSRFVVVFVLTVFAWMCCAGPIMAFHFNGLNGGVGRTRIYLVVLVAVVALMVVVIHQFRTRAVRQSWAILATGFVLMLVVLRFFPWNWWSSTDWKSNEPAALREVVATPGPVEFGERKQLPGSDESLVSMHLGTRFEAVPPGYGFNRGWILGTLHWPDGTSLQRGNWSNSYLGPVAWNLMGASVSAAKSVQTLGEMGTAPSILATLALPRSLAVKFREHAPSWEAELRMAVYEGELVVDIPLKAGARGGRSGHLIEVRDVTLSKAKDHGLTLLIAETEPVVDFDSVPGFLTTAGRRGTPYTFYALVSRDRTKIAPLGDERLNYTMTGTVGIMQRQIVFAPQALANPADPSWLDDAHLMKVVFHRTGAMIRNVHADALSETEASRRKSLLSPETPKPAEAKPAP